MRSETIRKGEIAKCRVLLRAYEKGVTASVPTIETDYDLVLDVKGQLVRVQVKYAGASPSRASGAVELGLRRTTWTKKVLTYSPREIDALLVFIPQLDAVVWLPPKVWAGKTSLTLRYEDSRNRQKKRVLDARDFVW